MIRPILTEVAIFLAPFLLYAAYLVVTRAGVLDVASWSWRVIAWLTAAALASVIISFIVLAEFTGAPPNSNYVPAHMENDKFVPGQNR